jgi:hypothetical protein
MNKALSVFALIGLSLSLLGCTNNSISNEEPIEDIEPILAIEEVLTLDNFGEIIYLTPSEEDWCGDNCVIYPENGQMYIRTPESGSETFYPEGTDSGLEDILRLDNFGEIIYFTPSEEDWCGDNCVIYPENGRMYIRTPESGSPTFYPEGTDFQGNTDGKME